MRSDISFPSLSQADAKYAQDLWQSTMQPGGGLGEALLLAARTVRARLPRLSPERAERAEKELNRLGQISVSLYGHNLSDLAQSIYFVESEPGLAAQDDGWALAEPLRAVQEIGRLDGENGWVDTMEARPEHPDVDRALYAMQQVVSLSNTEPGDRYAFTPLGQTMRQYWQGASQSLVRAALRALAPGRERSDESQVDQVALTMTDLDLEEMSGRLRERVVANSQDWVAGISQPQRQEMVEILSDLHRFWLVDARLADRARTSLRDTLDHQHASIQETRVALAQAAVAALGFDGNEMALMAEGVIPADAETSQALRRFRAAQDVRAPERPLPAAPAPPRRM